MDGDNMRILDLDDLRKYVHHTICDYGELETNVFEVTERILVRRGRPCGVFFCLHGPRSVKLTAIWETDRNSILFYGSTGQRMRTINLSASPQIQLAAA